MCTTQCTCIQHSSHVYNTVHMYTTQFTCVQYISHVYNTVHMCTIQFTYAQHSLHVYNKVYIYVCVLHSVHICMCTTQCTCVKLVCMCTTSVHVFTVQHSVNVFNTKKMYMCTTSVDRRERLFPFSLPS